MKKKKKIIQGELILSELIEFCEKKILLNKKVNKRFLFTILKCKLNLLFCYKIKFGF